MKRLIDLHINHGIDTYTLGEVPVDARRGHGRSNLSSSYGNRLNVSVLTASSYNYTGLTNDYGTISSTINHEIN